MHVDDKLPRFVDCSARPCLLLPAASHLMARASKTLPTRGCSSPAALPSVTHSMAACSGSWPRCKAVTAAATSCSIRAAHAALIACPCDLRRRWQVSECIVQVAANGVAVRVTLTCTAASVLCRQMTRAPALCPLLLQAACRQQQQARALVLQRCFGASG